MMAFAFTSMQHTVWKQNRTYGSHFKIAYKWRFQLIYDDDSWEKNLYSTCLMPRRIIFLIDQVPWLKLLKTETLCLCSIFFVYWLYEIFFVSGRIYFSTSPPAFFCCIPHDVSNSAHLLPLTIVSFLHYFGQILRERKLPLGHFPKA